MPTTAKSHFDDDYGRALAICAQAASVTAEPLRSDLARSAVSFGVGALDAYLCDAFVDSLARAMKVCRNTGRALPSGYAKLLIPAGPLLASYMARPNWGLRMSARVMMEKDNMLQLHRIRDLFNPVLPAGQKFGQDTALLFIAVDRKRLCGINVAEYGALSAAQQAAARRKAASDVLKRIGTIVQRRHDIVHNCDRPKSTPKPLKPGSAKNMLTDIGDFVDVIDAHLEAHRTY